MSRFLAASLLLLSAAGMAMADDTPRKGQTGDVDLAILSGDRPVHVRLRLTVEGKPLAQAWRKHMQKWFQFLDLDGNNLLDEKELSNAPLPLSMLQILRQGNFFFGSGQGIQPGSLGTERGATLADFMAFYMNNGAGPISFSPSQPFQDPQSQQLFAQLDRDNDGKLSKAELDAADQLVRKLDADDDETVSALELSGQNVNQMARFGGGMMGLNAAPPTTQANVFLLGSKGALQTCFERLDKNGDGKLTNEEFSVPANQFETLDTDEDGTLSIAELRRWADQAPDAEWGVTWNGNTAEVPGGIAKSVRTADMEMQFVPLSRMVFPKNGTPSTYYMNLFKAADATKKGFLLAAELQQPQNQILLRLFKLLDRDTNGKLTENEVQAFVDLQTEALASHVTLAFADQGRGLFQMLDGDRDGRLSSRELRSAWKRLQPFDRNSDGLIETKEIPRQCTLAAGFGYQALTYRPGIQFNGQVPIPNGGQPTRPAYPEGTPSWFAKMDLNGDGEVSRREFLGTIDDFRRMDSDGDGMVSAEEAKQFRRK
ncbi:MAG: EF-hand domain-containing protein [Gemmataceae bacterium]|nr:EF-hand domain-containing protein [Gemmataceae bacterium]